MDKYTGKRLDGRFEIQELIGVGGMARVYKAYDSVDDKTVAIKILKEEFLGNSDFIRRFKNESKAIAFLSHPNIVKVYDVSFGDKIQYIVMEYIDGITLKEYISHQEVIPWKEAVHFTVQILQALQHAHEKGIVHRDIKPQNIMLLQDGTIKVTDFGIARFADGPKTMTDKAIGSVHYIAPEQARAEETDGKADIYSVGVMLYEMLTGTLPFDGDSPVSVALMQVQNEPKPLREINSNIPEGIEEITLKAMRKEVSQRYASAKEMLDAIEIFRHNPDIKFRYNYLMDMPTKVVDPVEKKTVTNPEPVYEDDYDSYDDEAVTSRTRTAVKWLIFLVTILVISAIGVIVYMTVNNAMQANDTKNVDVPQFVGTMYDDITGNKAYKFKFEITAKYDDSKPVNVVLSQDPEAGSKQVKENSVIKLVINSTSTKNEVPKLKNYSEAEAIERVEKKHFKYNVSRVNSTDVAKGYVIACSPQEGTEQEIATTITLIVSDGPAPQKVEVPDVVGESYEQAKADLEAKGFTTQKSTVASNVEAGKVIGTDPLAGNTLTKGSLITIQVSDGSKIIRSLRQMIDLPADEYAEISVSIYVDGTKSEEVSGVPAQGFTKSVELDPQGAKNNQKIVTVMIDGTRYEVFTFDFKNQTVTRTYLNEDYRIKQGSPESSEEESSEEESSEEESSEEESSEEESSEDESSEEESSEDESSEEESEDESEEESYEEEDVGYRSRRNGFDREGLLWF